MVMSCKDWQPDLVKYLIIGESGTGKTRFCGTFPKPYVFSFDGGIDTLGGLDVDYDIYIDEERTKPTALARFRKDFDLVKKDPKYQTIVLDNVTNLSKLILDELIYINQLIDKNLGDKCWDFYRIVKNRMYDVITDAHTTQKSVICTALPEWEADKNSGEVRVLPATEGRFRQEMAAWFGEVYYAWVDKDAKGNKRYTMRTKGDGKFIAKSRLDEVIKRRGGAGMPEYLEPSYASIMKALGIQA